MIVYDVYVVIHTSTLIYYYYTTLIRRGTIRGNSPESTDNVPSTGWVPLGYCTL